MIDKVRELVMLHGGIAQVIELSEDTDLYRAGMKSFASVQLMLAIEEAFDFEFPEEMLNRETFRSPGAIQRAVAELAPGSVAA